MILSFLHFTILGMAAIPLIYYSLAIFSAWQFFRTSHKTLPRANYTPPISNLKPIRGLDPDAYENFASFCRQDYPEYEIVFCVGDASEPALPTIQRLIRDFPECQIRVLIGSGRVATNDKVAKLARLTAEAKYETVVMSDSDVRVQPDYLRTIVAGLADPKVGAVTCFYAPVPSEEKTLVQRVQSVGMLSDFYAGILVARQLDGVKFALGPTIATTRTRLAGFGGYAAIENRPADDLLVGRLIAEQGSRTAELHHPDSVRLSFAARPFSQATALDCGNAHHASLGALWADLYPGSAVGSGRNFCPAHARDSLRLSERLFRLPHRHDGSDWKVGTDAAGHL